MLEDSYGLAPALLQRVLEQALQLGQTCLVCYTPLQPDGAPAHLLVPGAGAAFVASSPDFPYAGERCTLRGTRRERFCGRQRSMCARQSASMMSWRPCAAPMWTSQRQMR